MQKIAFQQKKVIKKNSIEFSIFEPKEQSFLLTYSSVLK